MSLTPTKISWTDETWNPTTGCKKVNDGCNNCYAIRDANRLQFNPNEKVAKAYKGTVSKSGKNWSGQVNIMRERFDEPERKTRARRIFVNSMSDLGHEKIKYDDFVEIMRAIDKANEMAQLYKRQPHLYQILTKRYKRMNEFLWQLDDELRIGEGTTVAEMFKNVHFGYSASTQNDLNDALTYLLQLPVAFRWLSLEPLIERVSVAKARMNINALEGLRDFRNYYHTTDEGDDVANSINWAVVGGESGSKARLCALRWIHALVDEFKQHGTPIFVKQLGESVDAYIGDGENADIYKYTHRGKNDDITEFPEELRVQELPASHDYFLKQNAERDFRRQQKEIKPDEQIAEIEKINRSLNPAIGLPNDRWE